MVAKVSRYRYTPSCLDAGWSSLAARRAHNPKVVGSNPAPATSHNSTTGSRSKQTPSKTLFESLNQVYSCFYFRNYSATLNEWCALNTFHAFQHHNPRLPV